MRIGQTSVITFGSRVVASLVGFLGTIYFARELGAEILGVYSLVLAVVMWLGIAGKVGFTDAIQKRISEGDEQDAFFSAGVITIGFLFVGVAGVVYLFRAPLTAYVGSNVTGYVVLLLFVSLLSSLTNSALIGYHLAHVRGLLIPVRMTSRTLVQVGAVSIGFGLYGMLAGAAVGYGLVGLIGLWIVSPSLKRPSKHHFRSLKSYAKYSWLGTVRSRVFSWMDIIILGIFVTPDLIGIYSVSWTIGSFFLSFGGAITSATFPEVSKSSAGEGNDSIAPILQDALSYAGLFVVPGLVGAILLGPRILQIYGPEFRQGTAVLAILVSATLVQSYQQQLTSTLNAIDRPAYTFRVNVVFVITNALANVGLVYALGWIGAAVATALSAALATGLSYYYIVREVDFTLSIRELLNQWIAAAIMGGVVYAGLWVESTYAVLSHNVGVVLLLIAGGVVVYFAVLLTISAQFRTVVRSNLPLEAV